MVPIGGSGMAAHLPVSWSGYGNGNNEWWQILRSSRHSVLLLDFDGTLAPLVREPMQARMYPGVAERLLLLSTISATRLVLISGRALRDLAQLIPKKLRMEVWGSHGREQLLPSGEYHALSPDVAQEHCLEELESRLRQVHARVLTEKKVGSLAIHTRGLPQAEAGQIASTVHNFLVSMRTGDCAVAALQWLPFDGGFELRVPGCTKGSAVQNILHDEPQLVPVAYLGDDQTDEDAFAALEQREPQAPSLRVLVRNDVRLSTADLWLKPPDELLSFLDRWHEAVSEASPAEEAFQ